MARLRTLSNRDLPRPGRRSLESRVRSLLGRRRCSCGCGLGPRHLDVFRGLRLIMFLCLGSIGILAGKAGLVLKSWSPFHWCNPGGGLALGLLGLPVSIEPWECDLCEKIGKGDANSFFALDEIDHFLESRCRGSLRRPVVPETAAASPPQPPPELETGRTIVVGLGRTWVEAGQTLFINAGTREAFKVQRLIVPSSVAASFMIEGISIRSHQILDSRYPAIFFTEAWQQSIHWKCDVVCYGLFTMAVTNMGEKGTSFQGALVGPAMSGSDSTTSPDAPSGGSQIAERELAALLADAKS